jgi:hypothetical protein
MKEVEQVPFDPTEEKALLEAAFVKVYGPDWATGGIDRFQEKLKRQRSGSPFWGVAEVGGFFLIFQPSEFTKVCSVGLG